MVGADTFGALNHIKQATVAIANTFKITVMFANHPDIDLFIFLVPYIAHRPKNIAIGINDIDVDSIAAAGNNIAIIAIGKMISSITAFDVFATVHSVMRDNQFVLMDNTCEVLISSGKNINGYSSNAQPNGNANINFHLDMPILRARQYAAT